MNAIAPAVMVHSVTLEIVFCIHGNTSAIREQFRDSGIPKECCLDLHFEAEQRRV
jgi:hypothetical protein